MYIEMLWQPKLSITLSVQFLLGWQFNRSKVITKVLIYFLKVMTWWHHKTWLPKKVGRKRGRVVLEWYCWTTLTNSRGYSLKEYFNFCFYFTYVLWFLKLYEMHNINSTSVFAQNMVANYHAQLRLPEKISAMKGLIVQALWIC